MEKYIVNEEEYNSQTMEQLCKPAKFELQIHQGF